MIQGVNPTVRPPATPAARDAVRDEQHVGKQADGAVDSLELSEATRKQLDAGDTVGSRDFQLLLGNWS